MLIGDVITVTTFQLLQCNCKSIQSTFNHQSHYSLESSLTDYNRAIGAGGSCICKISCRGSQLLLLMAVQCSMAAQPLAVKPRSPTPTIPLPRSMEVAARRSKPNSAAHGHAGTRLRTDLFSRTYCYQLLVAVVAAGANHKTHSAVEILTCKEWILLNLVKSFQYDQQDCRKFDQLLLTIGGIQLISNQ